MLGAGVFTILVLAYLVVFSFSEPHHTDLQTWEDQFIEQEEDDQSDLGWDEENRKKQKARDADQITRDNLFRRD